MQQCKYFNTEVTLDTEIHIIKKCVKDLAHVFPHRSSGLAFKIYLPVGRAFTAVGGLFGEHDVMSLCMEMLELWDDTLQLDLERWKVHNYF